MPATMMLRTSPYAGGMLAFVAIAHASRICFGSSLIRPSMSSGSAARIRSTDSITDVSRVSVIAITGPLHHAREVLERHLDVRGEVALKDLSRIEERVHEGGRTNDAKKLA